MRWPGEVITYVSADADSTERGRRMGSLGNPSGEAPVWPPVWPGTCHHGAYAGARQNAAVASRGGGARKRRRLGRRPASRNSGEGSGWIGGELKGRKNLTFGQRHSGACHSGVIQAMHGTTELANVRSRRAARTCTQSRLNVGFFTRIGEAKS